MHLSKQISPSYKKCCYPQPDPSTPTYFPLLFSLLIPLLLYPILSVFYRLSYLTLLNELNSLIMEFPDNSPNLYVFGASCNGSRVIRKILIINENNETLKSLPLQCDWSVPITKKNY